MSYVKSLSYNMSGRLEFEKSTSQAQLFMPKKQLPLDPYQNKNSNKRPPDALISLASFVDGKLNLTGPFQEG